MSKTKIVSIAAAFVMAIASYFVLETPIEDALQIALDKEKAIATCKELIEGEQE